MQENETEIQDVELMEAELAALKTRADQMGIKYHPSIGAEKLREKVQEALQGAASQEDNPTPKETNGESDSARKARKRREASELIRVRITCMNPNKKEYEGEIFTVGNSLVGTMKKYVPFGVEWHVPRIMLNMIKSRKCQVFQTSRDPRGNRIKEGKLIKEFSIEELPPLCEKELKELARRQAMKSSVDE